MLFLCICCIYSTRECVIEGEKCIHTRPLTRRLTERPSMTALRQIVTAPMQSYKQLHVSEKQKYGEI